MKINRLLHACLVSSVVVSIVACTSKFDDYNTNQYAATDDQMQADDYKIQAAMGGMQGHIIPVSEHGYQFLEALIGGPFAGYMADSKGWSTKFETYNPSQDWINKSFKETIPNIYKNFNLLKAATTDPVLLAIGNVIRVAAMMRVTDMFGPIPYSKIGLDGGLDAPYDSQKEVYKNMFTELDAAIATLTARKTDSFSPKADKIYAGSVMLWIKFANSIKLRMALRISYADDSWAHTKATEALSHEVGVISNNSENAYVSTVMHPLVKIMKEWSDSRIGADITSYMNGFADPRRSQYFTESTFGSGNGFHGLRIGVSGAPADAAKYTSINMKNSENRILLMNAAEVAFLRAECALRWQIGKSVQEYYQDGIRLSFEQHGATNVEAYLSESHKTPESYKDPLGKYTYTGTSSNVTIGWNEADDFEKKLEKIITQKWIALFPLGNEAWAEFRRTGYPKLMESPDNQSGGTILENQRARRVSYPQAEYTDNKTNMSDALKKLGGPDNMSTRLWWDCKK